MAENTANLIPSLDWREDAYMAHANCLALKICAIIQVFSMYKTNSEYNPILEIEDFQLFG